MEAKMALVEVFRKFTVTTSDKTPSPLPLRNKGLTLAVVGDNLWLAATEGDSGIFFS